MSRDGLKMIGHRYREVRTLMMDEFGKGFEPRYFQKVSAKGSKGVLQAFLECCNNVAVFVR
jgi:hypothetical protein